MLSNRNNILTAYFHPAEPTDSIRHQRSTIRRSKVLTIKSSNLEFNEASTTHIPQPKIKQHLERQSPILIRRYRPSIENLSSHQQPSDMIDVLGNQLQLIPPPQSSLRKKSPRISSFHSKPLNSSKTIYENPIKLNSKFSYSFQTPIWTPILTEKDVIIPRSSRSKSLSLKPQHQLKIDKKNAIFDLHISSISKKNDSEIFKKTNVKDLIDEWDDSTSNVAVLSDEDDFIITNCNTPQKSDQFSSWTLIPNHHSFSNKSNLSRRPFSFYLPAVVEDDNDEIV